MPRVILLDGFCLQLDGKCQGPAGDDLPRGVQRLVGLVSLSLRPSRIAVAGQLWPDLSEDHAQASLRSTLWRLHKVVPGLVEVTGGRLSLAAGVRVDVRELREWSQCVLDRDADTADVTVPDAALRGELLPGWYDEWILLEREQLRQLRIRTLEALGEKLLRAGRHCEALDVAYAAICAEPLREAAHRLVVQVHLFERNAVEALRAYDLYREMLRDELGVPPTPEMTRLVEGFLGSRPASG